ncbi:MAG: hypothetical protein ABIB55_00780 [Candidatus Nealsonbacteria bacterium]
MKKDKTRLILITTITIILLATISLYGYTVVSKREVTAGSLISFIIPLLVIVFMALFITKRYKDMKQGVPFEDERSKKVINQAAAKSFYVSLYWLLAISWFEPFFAKNLFGVEKLDAVQTVGGAIGGMAIFFFIFWFYYNKKG